jgi:hypothetical protein
MIDIGQHFEFIFGAYAVTFALVIGLAFFIQKDFKDQQKRLADLEAQGVRRRSDKA